MTLVEIKIILKTVNLVVVRTAFHLSNAEITCNSSIVLFCNITCNASCKVISISKMFFLMAVTCPFRRHNKNQTTAINCICHL